MQTDDFPPSLLDAEKRVRSYLQNVLDDKQLTLMVNEFGAACLRRSSVVEGFEQFIKQQKFSGKRCIEIGTAKGLTAIVLARYFDEVVTLDNRQDQDKVNFAKFCGVRDKISFFDIKENSEKAALIKGYTFDAAYVDGNHQDDTEFDFSLVKHCGRVLFHEYWKAQPSVVALVDRLRNTGRVVTQGKFALWTA